MLGPLEPALWPAEGSQCSQLLLHLSSPCCTVLLVLLDASNIFWRPSFIVFILFSFLFLISDFTLMSYSSELWCLPMSWFFKLYRYFPFDTFRFNIHIKATTLHFMFACDMKAISLFIGFSTFPSAMYQICSLLLCYFQKVYSGPYEHILFFTLCSSRRGISTVRCYKYLQFFRIDFAIL